MLLPVDVIKSSRELLASAIGRRSGKVIAINNKNRVFSMRKVGVLRR
ncbi:hypothetical protein [Salipiger mucosus]|nr:hypothetical protein [Salipiger mucosus]